MQEPEFSRPLAVPTVVDGEVVHGTRVFRIAADEGVTDFGQGGSADTIGLNQPYLGPTLRMRRGERVRVEVANRLDEMTTVHWHGMHVPARMDGGPHQMIEPGRTWSPTWLVDQPAATLWYHAHPHGATAQQVYRGLAGMLLVDEATSAGGRLPSRYGVDDVPVIVQDKSFTSEGQLIVDPEGTASTGFLGDTLVVNGTVGPYFDVTTEAIRLRLLNASNARIYDFGFDDDRQFQIVATDGGLLPAPLPVDRVQLSPGERAEIVVRVRPGEQPVLTSYPPDLGHNLGRGSERFGTGTFGVLQLRAGPTLRPAPDVPATLASLAPVDDSAAVRTRTFGLSGRAINGRPMDMGRIDEVVPVGQAEVWAVTNQDPQPHNFHVHDGSFRVLSVDGVDPPPVLAGLKDTVYVAPRTTVRLLVRFSEYTDPTWPYMYHCHLVLHEDLGIMGQFVVVKPGQRVHPPDHDAH